MWCWHQWEVTATEISKTYSHRDPLGKELPITIETNISLRCRNCGMPRMKTVDGIWRNK